MEKNPPTFKVTYKNIHVFYIYYKMWQHRANISWLKQSVADGLSRRDWRLEHMAPGPCTWGSFPPLPPGH